MTPLVSCTTFSAQNEQGPLKIGWAKRSLDPAYPVPILGQFYLRVSLGTYTPVYASCLLLENGKDLVAFVSCDMRDVNPDVLLKVQALLRAEIPGFPAEKLIINATHTHAGPGSADVGDYPRKVEMKSGEEVRIFLARQIADAVKEAWEKRAPGSIAYGYGFATTGHSRRTVYLEDIGKKYPAKSGIAVNGFAKMYGKTNDPLFASYEAGTDSFINLLYAFDASGKLSAAVINVPCPSQTNEHSWELHASFWHQVREKLTEKYGDICIVGQSAAAGDLAPRQLHYLEAEKRRYKLKYPDKIAQFMANPMKRPPVPGEDVQAENEKACLDFMRAEDIADRIVAAFDEVLSWAGKEKISNPKLKHEVRTVNLSRRMFPKDMMEAEKANLEALMKEQYVTDGDPWTMLRVNSKLRNRRNGCNKVIKRYEIQDSEPEIPSDLHAVRIGDIAFVSCRFELFIDYMHRIQARSPFIQTFIVQLTTEPNGSGSYLATERAEKNKGYSASPYCNQVSYKGGQQLVEESLKMLEELKDK